MIMEHRPLAVLTGAGVSTAAGLPDFRGPQGLYVTRAYDPERVFEIAAFKADPRPFFDFTRDFLSVVDGVAPTATHRLLAVMEERGWIEAVVTQNIDALHQRAGSRHVIEVHGSYWNSHCLSCRASFGYADMRAMVSAMPVPMCSCGGVIKPDVVFFGEPVHALEEAETAIRSAGMLLVLGSSLTVYPAAWLPEAASGPVVVINLGEIGLAAGPNRWLVEADLDDYLGEVAAELGLEEAAEDDR